MKYTLSQKILIPTLLTVAIGLITATYLSHLYAKSVVQQELAAHLQREVTIITRLMDGWLGERKKDISAWSTLEICRDALTETGYYGRSARKGASVFLSDLESGYPYYDLLFLSDTTGDVIASSHAIRQQSLTIANRKYFQEALLGHVVISQVIASKESGKKIFTVSAPVYAEDELTIVGVIVAAVDLVSFSTLFIEEFRQVESGYAHILDHQGALLAVSQNVTPEDLSHPDDFSSNIKSMTEGSIIHKSGKFQSLTSFQKLNTIDWFFCITQSLDEILLPLKNIGKFSMYISTIILIAISIIISLVFKNIIIDRLSKILEVITRMQHGDLQKQIPDDTNLPDEISELTTSFNDMTLKLELAMDKLHEEIYTRKKTESALEHHQENLEEMIRRRSIELEREVNERKKVEEKLHQAEKMEMIGTLAGGVAHDLNNILSGIVSYPDLLLQLIDEDSKLRTPLKTIKESGVKASTIVQDLLTLARRGVAVKEKVNLNSIITSYLESPEYTQLIAQHNAITITSLLADDLLPVSGSPIHLAKTIMNLVTNAVESMENGGQIVIETHNRYIDTPFENYDTVAEGDYAVIIIRDQGHGIEHENITKIFEPFYSRKKLGRSGTGLGMAVVWGTIKDHNGYIICESAIGSGTTFTLFLPVSTHLPDQEQESPVIENIYGNNESLLVIDDVLEQREIASAILTELGYRVLAAASGEEAVLYARNESFDLLILDMILGEGMDGLDTYKSILEINPNQKAIITSGFSETDRITETLRLGAGQYIKKPYMMYKIGLAVKQELQRKRV
jgi:signal transduction histidine kinase/ActR/RegA family two-component response regulator